MKTRTAILFPLRPRRGRRGLTYVEMMVAIGVFSFISVTVAWVTLVAARLSSDSIRMIQSERSARQAADLIRKETLVGEFLSVTVSDAGKTVRFHDPVRGSTTLLSFQRGLLLYQQQEGSATGARTLRGLSDAAFALESNGAILRFDVTSPASLAGNTARPITLTDRILLRNLPNP